MRRLTPVLFPIAWPGPEYREGLYLHMDGDVHVIWAETPEGGWKAQAAIEVEPQDARFISESLRRQLVRIKDDDLV